MSRWIEWAGNSWALIFATVVFSVHRFRQYPAFQEEGTLGHASASRADDLACPKLIAEHFDVNTRNTLVRVLAVEVHRAMEAARLERNGIQSHGA